MTIRILAAGLVFGAAAIAPPAVMAQNGCAPRDAIVEKLAQKYSEKLTGGGLQNANTLLEVWTSEKTGSFTVLMTHANGVSCIVASGQDWTSTEVAMVPEDTAS
jgi:hypothetical protein